MQYHKGKTHDANQINNITELAIATRETYAYLIQILIEAKFDYIWACLVLVRTHVIVLYIYFVTMLPAVQKQEKHKAELYNYIEWFWIRVQNIDSE